MISCTDTDTRHPFSISNYIKNNDIKLSNYPKAIFSTAEKLFPHMRTTIEEVFNTKVFDTYGLNDGGVSAFECQNHNGMHMNTRSLDSRGRR